MEEEEDEEEEEGVNEGSWSLYLSINNKHFSRRIPFVFSEK